MNRFIRITLLSFLATGYLGCSSAGNTTVEREQPDTTRPTSDHYTSAFPDRDVSDKIVEIFMSVKRITSTSTYQIYYFEDSLVTYDEVRRLGARNLATRRISKNESTAGTAISIAQSKASTLLLTCAHVIEFPDTMVEFIEDENIPAETYVQSVAHKQSQRNLVFELPHVADFTITDIDPKEDLALIEYSRISEPDLEAPPLAVQLGDSRKLAWGSFIYHAGYPKGVPIITRGLVSNPNKSPRGDYQTDVLFNPGASGGILLASRDHFESFEWIGVANSVIVSTEYILVPDPYHYKPEKVEQPYDGQPFVERKTRIAYGVTQSIPTSVIRDFLKRNASSIRNKANHLNIF